MSSSSAARKNRRMRLKQQSSALPLVSKLQTWALDTANSESINGCKVDTIADSSRKQKALPEGFNHSFTVTANDRDNQKCSATVTDGSIGESTTYSSEGGNSQTEMYSHATGKIFIEEDKGFRVVDIHQLLESAHNENVEVPPKRTFAIDLAYDISKYFHSFCNFCHGLLGGLSLLHCLILYHFISLRTLDGEIIEHFSFLSKPIHNLFNFLCVICCVSAFDRYDVENTKTLWKFITSCNLKLVVIFIYPLCLVFSLTAVNIDDKLSLHSYNSSSWIVPNYEGIESELFYWKAVTIGKCVGCIIGWIIIAGESNFNSFLDLLRSIANMLKTDS